MEIVAGPVAGTVLPSSTQPPTVDTGASKDDGTPGYLWPVVAGAGIVALVIVVVVVVRAKSRRRVYNAGAAVPVALHRPAAQSEILPQQVFLNPAYDTPEADEAGYMDVTQVDSSTS